MPFSTAGWAAALIALLGVAAMVTGAIVALTRGGDGAPPTVAAAAVVGAVPLATPVPSPRAATPTVAPPAATPTAAPPVACGARCLVRLVDAPASRDLLSRFGVRPVYAHGGQMWAAIPVGALPDLAPVGPVAVVADAGDTLLLHVMRVPEGGDPAPVLDAGEVLDRVGNQFLVRVPTVPFAAAPLTNAGIWVEKLPPFPAGLAPTRADLPEIGDLGTLAAAVSTENLKTTVADLQGIGATDGGSGSRYYADSGNVAAAEYLYRRFEAYGLKVWYEDFITADGLLALQVVGEIPGRDASQVYLVLGHLDSITDTPETAPGADDNATGIAAMLEIARILSGYELAHPVRFLATNAEEVGILGAPVFAARAREEGVPYAGAYNVDAVGSAANGRLLILNADEGSVWLEDVLIEMNDRFGLGQELRVRQNPAIVADDNSLRAAGIPTVLLAREMYGWSATHHTPDDVLATVDFENVHATTQLVTLAIGSLVQE